jgi:dipeptidyl aminopeptidase/acylaminoacyl peptidase
MHMAPPPQSVEAQRAGPSTVEKPAPAKSVEAQPMEQKNLVLQGVPEVPAALRKRLGQYLNARSASLQVLADDGRSMLITTRFAQTHQVHRVTSPLGSRNQITFKPEPIRQATFQPKTTDKVLYVSDIGGNELYQIFRLDLASGKTSLLTDGKSRHGSYRWSHDGQQIAYTSNARNGKDMDLYLGDGRSADTGRLFLERQGHWLPKDWSQDGKRLLVEQYISINDSRLYVIDVASRQIMPITPVNPRASYRDARFDRTGKQVYVTTDREGEFVELYSVDLAKKTWRPLTRAINWNVEGLDLSPDGKTLAFSVNEGGSSALYLLNTRSGGHRKVTTIPPGVISGLQFARKAQILGFSLTSATLAGDAYTYDLRRRTLTRWTSSELGGLNPSRFVEPTLIQYETFDGRKIPAFYFKPTTSGPHPVVVWIHGGPESQSRLYFRETVQFLVNESGIAVLIPNVRGSDGYGKSYLLLDNGAKREDSVKDIGALLDWIARQKELDEKRVGVLGGSYGGYMVLASLVHFPERIKAGVDIVGISNFVTFLTNTKAYRRNLRRAEYGDERDPKMHALLQRISPSNNAHKIRSALFVAHGANDPRVPLSETDQIVQAVSKQGKDVWYMVARNEGHGFRKKENRDMFWTLSVLFFEKHLKGQD